ncbi:MAG: WYL domain-containing protein [Acidimicrobiia bacterium]|nr:WYL domain-containing protein [Acidimicrobiia bacterium]MDH5519999.1 WYL domain-containing protein [Acidimicrobiia bacterium]
MSVTKLERLLNLTAVLLNTARPLTAEQIRRRVEGYPDSGSAFHRAFERDKDDLRVMGIPLTVERVPATDPPVDGYRIDPAEYYLADPGLDPDELAALHLASLSVRVDGIDDDEEALWKLGGLASDSVDGGARTATLRGSGGASAGPGVMQGVVANLPTDPALVPIFQAITANETISFPYRGNTRTLDPWRLDFHRGRWYLTGYDHDRDGQRNFRLDRIEGAVERTGRPVASQRPASVSDGPLQAWEFGSDRQVTARLLVDESHASAAARFLGPDVSAERRNDGSIVFDVPVVRTEAFRTFVLGFLEHAEILEPAELRQEMIDWLQAIVAHRPAGSVASGAEGADR